jgi:hypothetical protein
MPAQNVLNDDDFEALVERLHAMSLESPAGTIDRWRIRLLLADTGILPMRAAVVPSLEDGFYTAIRAICGRPEEPDFNAEAA